MTEYPVFPKGSPEAADFRKHFAEARASGAETFTWQGRLYTTALAEPPAEGPRHVSIDLETLGTKPTALILSIGAVAFDSKTGEQTDDGFYRIIDIGHSIGGGDIDASTVNWWMKQSQEARDELFGDATKDQRVNLRVALSELSTYLGFDETIPEGKFPDLVLWQRGNLDSQWLDSAYKGMQLATPFAYWQWSDERTFTKYFKQFLPERGDMVAHNAFDDALYQALCVSSVFQRLAALGHNVDWVKPKPKPKEEITTVVNIPQSITISGGENELTVSDETIEVTLRDDGKGGKVLDLANKDHGGEQAYTPAPVQ